jgi:hypothetical protein
MGEYKTYGLLNFMAEVGGCTLIIYMVFKSFGQVFASRLLDNDLIMTYFKIKSNGENAVAFGNRSLDQTAVCLNDKDSIDIQNAAPQSQYS